MTNENNESNILKPTNENNVETNKNDKKQKKGIYVIDKDTGDVKEFTREEFINWLISYLIDKSNLFKSQPMERVMGEFSETLFTLDGKGVQKYHVITYGEGDHRYTIVSENATDNFINWFLRYREYLLKDAWFLGSPEILRKSEKYKHFYTNPDKKILMLAKLSKSYFNARFINKTINYSFRF